MINPIQNYEWGSYDFIQNLLNVHDLCQEPCAELWMGAHPRAGSIIASRQSALNELIQREPQHWLGDKCLQRGFDQLPFLFKILASRKPLSIQAHPDLQTAQQGFARENALGLAIDHPFRSFKDPFHKPELIIALTDFHALCGFRKPDEIALLINILIGDLSFQPITSFRIDPCDDTLTGLFRFLLTSDQTTTRSIIVSYRNGLSQLINTMNSPSQIRQSDAEYFRAIAHWSERLAWHYPDDIGILAPILFNLVCLKPFQALFIPPRLIHSYLEGSGAEIMANSDSVLRCALTHKHRDIDLLMQTALIAPSSPHLIDPVRLNKWEFAYPAPVREFAFAVIESDESLVYDMPLHGNPHILFCLDGCFFLTEKALEATTHNSNENDNISIQKGGSVFLTPGKQFIRIRGKGTILHATVSGQA